MIFYSSGLGLLTAVKTPQISILSFLRPRTPRANPPVDTQGSILMRWSELEWWYKLVGTLGEMSLSLKVADFTQNDTKMHEKHTKIAKIKSFSVFNTVPRTSAPAPVEYYFIQAQPSHG